MNNIRQGEISGKGAVAPTGAVKGQSVGEEKEPMVARLLVLRELAQVLSEREGQQSEEGAVVEHVELSRAEEEGEEDELTLRTALANMILSIEETTVELAELHSKRTDQTVEMSNSTLEDIDRTWDELHKNFEKADRLAAKMKKMSKIMKAVSGIVIACSAIAAGITLGLGSAAVVVAMAAVQPYMEPAIAGTAKGLQVVFPGMSEEAARGIASGLIVVGSAAAGGAAAGGAKALGATTVNVAKTAAYAGVTGYVATGGLLTTTVVESMKAAGHDEDSEAVMYTKMVLGMAETMAVGFAAAGPTVMKDLAATQAMLLKMVLVGGLMGAVGQASVGTAQGMNHYAQGDLIDARGEIEAERTMLQAGLKATEGATKAQGSHQRGLTQARESMTQSYGAMMAGYWKTTAHIIK